MKRENSIVGALAGLILGMPLHGAWMIFLFQIWPLRFLGWPSHTDVLHTTIIVVPHLGWEFEPLTAGLLGIIFPILFSLSGIMLGRNATRYWIVAPRVWKAVATFCGLSLAVNAFLLFLLLCLEN